METLVREIIARARGLRPASAPGTYRLNNNPMITYTHNFNGSEDVRIQSIRPPHRILAVSQRNSGIDVSVYPTPSSARPTHRIAVSANPTLVGLDQDAKDMLRVLHSTLNKSMNWKRTREGTGTHFSDMTVA